MSYDVSLTETAIGYGSATALSPVIGGGGFMTDNSDASYVDAVEQVVDHFGDGTDKLKSTKGYAWHFKPASTAPSFDSTTNHKLRIRAKIAVVSDDINLPSSSSWWLGFFLSRLSDDLAITGVGNIFLKRGQYPLNTPQWFTLNSDLSGGTVVPSDPWESLRTGVYPGYGPIGLGYGFAASPDFTGVSPLGAQSAFRLYEMKWTLQPGGWCVGEDHIGI